MATQGPNSPGTLADDNSYGSPINSWINPSNAGAADGSFATCTLVGLDTTHYLKATNFGFSIPGGATINGITVEIKRKSGAGDIQDIRVRIVKGGAVSTTDRSAVGSWGTVNAYTTYGGAADLWGESWTDTDINASNFGVVLAATSNFGDTASVDHIRITIDYTAGAFSPTTFPWPAQTFRQTRTVRGPVPQVHQPEQTFGDTSAGPASLAVSATVPTWPQLHPPMPARLDRAVPTGLRAPELFWAALQSAAFDPSTALVPSQRPDLVRPVRRPPPSETVLGRIYPDTTDLIFEPVPNLVSRPGPSRLARPTPVAGPGLLVVIVEDTTGVRLEQQPGPRYPRPRPRAEGQAQPWPYAQGEVSSFLAWEAPWSTPTIWPRAAAPGLFVDGPSDLYRLHLAWVVGGSGLRTPSRSWSSGESGRTEVRLPDDDPTGQGWRSEWVAPTRAVPSAGDRPTDLPVEFLPPDLVLWEAGMFRPPTVPVYPVNRPHGTEVLDLLELADALGVVLASCALASQGQTVPPARGRKADPATVELAQVAAEIDRAALFAELLTPVAPAYQHARRRSSPEPDQVINAVVEEQLVELAASFWLTPTLPVPLRRRRPSEEADHVPAIAAEEALAIEVRGALWITPALPTPGGRLPNLGGQAQTIEPEALLTPLTWRQDSQPVRWAPVIAGGQVQKLDADPPPHLLPYTQEIRPRYIQPLAPQQQPASADVSPLAVGLIVVVGPYYLVAIDVYCAGLIAGEVTSP